MLSHYTSILFAFLFDPLLLLLCSRPLQAIDAAIEAGLSRVEAGAQGEHKLARGYLPVPTFSAHYITDVSFRSAVADFLRRETMQVCVLIEG